MKRLLWLLSSILVLSTGCRQSDEKRLQISKAQADRLRTEDSLALKVAVLPTLDALPLWVANDCGLFDKEHVDVRLKVYSAHMDIDTALMRGRVEGAMTDCFRVDKMEKEGLSFERLDVTDLHWCLIANRSSRVKAVRQLGDKMIAMTRHSATDYLCDRVLEGVKTSADVFRVQVNDVKLRLDMLINNEIDAMWLPEPHATLARQAGHVQLADSRQIKDSLGVLVFCKNGIRDLRRQNQMEAFLRAYRQACDSIEKSGLHSFADIISNHTPLHNVNLVDSIPLQSTRR